MHFRSISLVGNGQNSVIRFIFFLVLRKWQLKTCFSIVFTKTCSPDTPYQTKQLWWNIIKEIYTLIFINLFHLLFHLLDIDLKRNDSTVWHRSSCSNMHYCNLHIPGIWRNKLFLLCYDLVLNIYKLRIINNSIDN